MHTQRATRTRVHLDSISSIVPAVCTWFVSDLRPVAKINECSCLPAYLKTLIKLSTWRTSACVPTLTKNAVIGHFRVPKTVTFKMRLCAQPFLRKWVLLAWEWKIFFKSKAQGNLEMVYCELQTLKCLAKKYCIAMDKFQSVEALTLRLRGGARFHFVLCFLPWF